MEPHAGVTQVLGTYLQVCCSQIGIPSESCFSTLHPQIGVCLDGQLMITVTFKIITFLIPKHFTTVPVTVILGKLIQMTFKMVME